MSGYELDRLELGTDIAMDFRWPPHLLFGDDQVLLDVAWSRIRRFDVWPELIWPDPTGVEMS